MKYENYVLCEHLFNIGQEVDFIFNNVLRRGRIIEKSITFGDTEAEKYYGIRVHTTHTDQRWIDDNTYVVHYRDMFPILGEELTMNIKTNKDLQDSMIYSHLADVDRYAKSQVWHQAIDNTRIKLFDMYKKKPKIPTKFFFNEKKKTTTLLFGDDVTVVRCSSDETYDKRIGFLEAYFQATSGMSKNKANKYLKKIVEEI